VEYYIFVSAEEEKIFSWLLRTIFDTKGVNFIKFHYYVQKWYEL